MEVHYVGYDEMYEWKPRWQALIEGDCTDYSPFVELVSCMKKTLRAIRNDDPAVQIQVGFEYIHVQSVADSGWFLGFHGTPLWAAPSLALMIGYEVLIDRLNGTPLSVYRTKKTTVMAHLSML